ncbi:hypothetical protein EC973_001693 [Apophysomyces ossiformis]|uniref:Uncharacterized protein n=1 Tax=Apophysomyces ossiformis TaxID=679940 RepID=A0A8H7ERR1_9FUNG|nr:hypothetical protein EC973_001693 [Apophysomyces ossiformis]
MLTQLAPTHLDLGMTKQCGGMSNFQPSGPPSPSLSTTSFMSSMSWMAEKSSTELIPMLKNAYSALRDKEKDLMLAAEIGKSLLENNLHLKSSYESLLQKTHCSSTSPFPTPSTSYESDLIADDDDDDDDDSGHESEDDEAIRHGMQFIPSRGTRDAMIEVLEKKNSELSMRLETVVAEQESVDRSNAKKQRKLEAEISALKANLDIATTKIQELQEMNARQQRLEAAQQQQLSQEDQIYAEEMVDELLTKIDGIQTENEMILKSKAELEAKLAQTLADLRNLKKQCEQFQFTSEDHEALKEAYNRQFHYIAELNASLEEHRAVLQKLKDRGVNIYAATPTPSCCGTTIETRSAAYRQTLLGELESEWLKKNNNTNNNNNNKQDGETPTKRRSPSLVSLSLPAALSEYSLRSLRDISQFTEKSLMAFHHAPTELAYEAVLSTGSIDRQCLDEALSLISRLESTGEEDEANEDEDDDNDSAVDFSLSLCESLYPCGDLYPDPTTLECPRSILDQWAQAPKTFVGRIRRIVQRFFRAVWRWCRFAIVLVTAVLISVWNGPELMMIEY